jgi:hypothetical protein
MSVDFSAYRFTDNQQIKTFVGEIMNGDMYGYAIDVYKHYANMDPGSKFDIGKKVSEKTRPRFIKITCLYMIDFPGDIQVNDQFNTVTKI